MIAYFRRATVTTTCLVLLTAVVLGLLATFFAAYIFIGAIILSIGLVWVWWSRRHLRCAFAITLLAVILFSPRLSAQLLKLEGVDRGYVSVHDVLWLGLIIAVLSRKMTMSFPRSSLGVLPYIALAAILPVVGIIGGFPLSYATPGLRALEWASFGYMAYIIAKEYGVRETFSLMSKIMLWASVIHFAYACIQYAADAGIISGDFLQLDQIYAAGHEVSWFSWRVTGLFVNPNSYGLFCSFAALLSIALLVARPNWINPMFAYFCLVINSGGIFLSASRSGLLGFAIGLSGLLLIALVKGVKTTRLVKLGVVFGAMGVLFLVMLSVVTGGEKWVSRFGLISSVVIEGAAADPSMLERVEMWQQVFSMQEAHYPFGTGVPSGLALIGIDSYWIVTLTQGTLLFALAFLLMLATVFTAGYVCWRLPKPDLQALGLTVAAVTLSMAISSLLLTTPLETYIIIPFWSMAGLAFARKNQLVRLKS